MKKISVLLCLAIMLSVFSSFTIAAGAGIPLYIGEYTYLQRSTYMNYDVTYVSWTSSSLSGLELSEKSNYQCKVTAKKEGSYTVTATIDYKQKISTLQGDVYVTRQGTEYFTVEVLAPPPTAISLPSSMTIYAGETKQIPVTFTPENAQNNCSWESGNPNVATVSNGYVTGKSAGTAVITARTPMGLTDKCTVTVKSDGITFADKEFVYDGTEKQISITGSLPSGSSVQYTNDKKTNAGVYTVTAKITGSYSKTLTATMTIKQKELTVSGLSAENKTYDGTDTAALKGGAINGKVENDDVTAAFPTSGKFASANAGNNIDVTVPEITLSGSAKGNYTVKQPTGIRANITKAPISIKADDKQMLKGASVPELTYKIVEGKLIGTDTLSGTLYTSANGSVVGNFDILQGTLSASNNYSLTFKKGKLEVLDRTPQNISVSVVSEKKYGDDEFKITVTPDKTSGLNDFIFKSSNPEVAEIASDGTVKIKSAGETNLTVAQEGNETYAPYEKTQKLTVKKAPITVTADSKTKKIGSSDPELTYTYSGVLFGEDKFLGQLIRQGGEQVGKYDILIGTLAINDNYEISYNKAVFEITDKTPQNITVSKIPEKTYGDETFKLNVTPDATSGLSEFTYESDNTDVAEIAEDGTIIIKSAGEANITVKQKGNDEYAAFEQTQKLVVNKKTVTLTDINLEKKTAEIVGVIESDAEKVAIDFDKVNIVTIEEIDEDNTKVTVINLALTGDKSNNYELTTESIESAVKTDEIVIVDVVADNGTVTGGGMYLKGANVTITVTVNSGYSFNGWYVEDAVVSTNTTYSFAADSNITVTAKFTKHSSRGGGGGSSSTYTVKFDTNGGNELKNIYLKKGQSIGTIEPPVKKGFVFDGWYSDKDCTKAYAVDTNVSSAMTLYAGWKVDPARQFILTIWEKEAIIWNEHKSNDVAPIIRNDRTMLPARFVAEALGADVEWNGDEQKVLITRGDITIEIYIDSDKAYVNGNELFLDSPAFVENDRTYTPVRFIAEALGAKVDWEEETKQVIITKDIEGK